MQKQMSRQNKPKGSRREAELIEGLNTNPILMVDTKLIE